MTVEAQITINRNKTAVRTAITNIRDPAEMISGIEKIEVINQPVNGSSD